jgi:hypothetical protein
MLAIVFHAAHNLFVGGDTVAGLLVSWLIEWSGILVVLAVAALSWRNERRWMECELSDEIGAGVLSTTEYAEVISSSGRFRRQMRELLRHGWWDYRHVRRRHHLLTELAFRKTQLHMPPQTQKAGEPEMLKREIAALRDALAGLEARV